MLGRPHVSFRGLGHGLRKLFDRVDDIVVGDLGDVCEVHHDSNDCLVAPLLVQQLLLRLIQGQFRPSSGVYAGLQSSIP